MLFISFLSMPNKGQGTEQPLAPFIVRAAMIMLLPFGAIGLLGALFGPLLLAAAFPKGLFCLLDFATWPGIIVNAPPVVLLQAFIIECGYLILLFRAANYTLDNKLTGLLKLPKTGIPRILYQWSRLDELHEITIFAMAAAFFCGSVAILSSVVYWPWAIGLSGTASWLVFSIFAAVVGLGFFRVFGSEKGYRLW